MLRTSTRLANDKGLHLKHEPFMNKMTPTQRLLVSLTDRNFQVTPHHLTLKKVGRSITSHDHLVECCIMLCGVIIKIVFTGRLIKDASF